MIYKLIYIINVVALGYTMLIGIIYLIHLISAALSLDRYLKSSSYNIYDSFMKSQNMLPISILVPAYNEETTIVDNVKNLLNLDFPEYEVIVVNDGSMDQTLDVLKKTFSLVKVKQPIRMQIPTNQVNAVYHSTLYPFLIVIDKVNGGKADALNVGINVSKYPIFVSIDADSLLEKQSLFKIIMPFAKDHRVVSIGGIVRIASGCRVENGELVDIGLSKKPLVNFQTVEYLRAFLTGRIGFDAMGMLLIVSGAFGAFKKQEVIEVGGYTRNCIGEDMELTVKLHKSLKDKNKDYKIKFLPDPVCWTQPPSAYKDLKGQRKRWQIGLIDTLMKHRDMLLNRKYGRIGMLSLPYFWIFEFIGPIIETLGYIFVFVAYCLKIINIQFFIGFYVLSVLYGIMLSIGALMLEEYTFKKYPSIIQLIQLLFYAIIDNFGYRQINTLFKVEALLTYRKNKHSWGKIKREKFEN